MAFIGKIANGLQRLIQTPQLVVRNHCLGINRRQLVVVLDAFIEPAQSLKIILPLEIYIPIVEVHLGILQLEVFPNAKPRQRFFKLP
jgi:hypothetical protein